MVYAHSHFAPENGSHSTKEINILYNLIVHFFNAHFSHIS